MKRVLGAILTLITVICCTFAEPITIFAQERDIHAEYLAKKEAGLEVYEIISEDGTVWGYYEPYSESNPRPILQNAIYNLDWTLPANYTGWGDVLALEKGTIINLDISQDPSGASFASYIGLRDDDTGKIAIISNSITTNGWTGTIVVGYTGNFNLAIENASSVPITYTGKFSI